MKKKIFTLSIAIAVLAFAALSKDKIFFNNINLLFENSEAFAGSKKQDMIVCTGSGAMICPYDLKSAETIRTLPSDFKESESNVFYSSTINEESIQDVIATFDREPSVSNLRIDIDGIRIELERDSNGKLVEKK